MKREQSVWPAILLIIIVYAIAALVEPCDGHSCDADIVGGAK